MKFTKSEVILWARKNMSADDDDSIGKARYFGETQNGFYLRFWTEPKIIVPLIAASGAVAWPRFPAPGNPLVFVSRDGIVVLFARMSCLMFDHYLNEKLVVPKPALDEQGHQVHYKGLSRYKVDQRYLIAQFDLQNSSGVPCHERYGSFPNPEDLEAIEEEDFPKSLD